MLLGGCVPPWAPSYFWLVWCRIRKTLSAERTTFGLKNLFSIQHAIALHTFFCCESSTHLNSTTSPLESIFQLQSCPGPGKLIGVSHTPRKTPAGCEGLTAAASSPAEPSTAAVYYPPMLQWDSLDAAAGSLCPCPFQGKGSLGLGVTLSKAPVTSHGQYSYGT